MKRAGLLLSLAMLCGCSYVRTMDRGLKTRIAAGDTIYVLPARAAYVNKGFILSRADSAKIKAIESGVDSILPQELARVFPSAKIQAAEGSGFDSTRATVVSCRVKGFRRTLPRQIASDALDIVTMVPTFGMSLGFPIQTTSNVYLEIRNPGLKKPARLKDRDMVNAADQEDLRYQIRKMLDSSFPG